MSTDYIQGYSKLQKEQIEGLDARLSSAQNAINSNRTSYDSMVAANDSKNTEQDNRLTALDNMTDGRMKLVEDRATSLEGRATSLETRATDLEAGTADLNNQTTALRTRASALETRAGALEGRATALESRAGQIESTASTFRSTYDSKMAALDTKDAELLANINTRVLQTDYNTKTASLDALNTAMNKRFFAVEEFIRTMLGTYGIQEKDANGNVVSTYQYTGAIQNLSIKNASDQPDTNVFKVVKKEADGSNWKLHLQLTTYAYNQLASGQIKVGSNTAAQSAFTYNSTSKYYEGKVNATGSAPFTVSLESTVGGVLFSYTVTQDIFNALETVAAASGTAMPADAVQIYPNVYMYGISRVTGSSGGLTFTIQKTAPVSNAMNNSFMLYGGLNTDFNNNAEIGAGTSIAKSGVRTLDPLWLMELNPYSLPEGTHSFRTMSGSAFPNFGPSHALWFSSSSVTAYADVSQRYIIPAGALVW